MELILLHGALGSKELFSGVKNQLNAHTISFSGHGNCSFNDEGFNIATFGREVIDYMDQHNINQARFFGHSMGGYVALHLACHFPDRVEKVVTLGTKLEWNEEIANTEIKNLNPEKIEAKVPKFAGLLRQRHGDSWKELLNKTGDVMIGLGKSEALSSSDFRKILCEVTLCLGEFDNMVSVDETRLVSELIPQGNFQLIDNLYHPLEKITDTQLVQLVSAQLTNQ